MKVVLLFAASALISSSLLAGEGKPGKQVELKFETEGAASVPYLLYLPEDYGKDAQRKWPVLLFLHGRGESYGPLGIVKKWGPPRMAERGDDLKYIIVSPQCPGKSRWREDAQQAAVAKLLEHVMKTYSTDEKRVLLTGLSMGGYGSWELASRHPEKFAAVAPICGGGKPENAEKLKDIPIWVWHGDEDKPVPFSKSVEMVEAIRKAGGEKIRFTSLEGVGHNAWSSAYATPELWSWFDRQALP